MAQLELARKIRLAGGSAYFGDGSEFETLPFAHPRLCLAGSDAIVETPYSLAANQNRLVYLELTNTNALHWIEAIRCKAHSLQVLRIRNVENAAALFPRLPKGIRAICYHGKPLTYTNSLDHLDRFSGLEWLEITVDELSSELVDKLSNCESLSHLAIEIVPDGQREISCLDFSVVERFPNLETLVLYTPVFDYSRTPQFKLSPKLRLVEVWSTSVPDYLESVIRNAISDTATAEFNDDSRWLRPALRIVLHENTLGTQDNSK